jgi:hypothetical protein
VSEAHLNQYLPAARSQAERLFCFAVRLYAGPSDSVPSVFAHYPTTLFSVASLACPASFTA